MSIIISKIMISNSYDAGFRLLEKGMFLKALEHFDFVLRKSQQYQNDQYIKYGCAVCWYQLDKYDIFFSELNKLKKIENVNYQLIKILEDMAEKIPDIKERKFRPSEIKRKKILNQMNLTEEEALEISKATKDTFFKVLSSEITMVESKKILVIGEKIMKKVNSTKEKILELKKNKDTIQIYFEINKYFNYDRKKYIILFLFKQGILDLLLNDDDIHDYLKNELIYEISFLKAKGYLKEDRIKLRINKENIEIPLNDNELFLKQLYEINNLKKQFQNTKIEKEINLMNYFGDIVIKYYKTHFISMSEMNFEEVFKKVISYFISTKFKIDDKIHEYFKKELKIDYDNLVVDEDIKLLEILIKI